PPTPPLFPYTTLFRSLTRTPAYTTSSQIFVSFHGAESTSELATGTTYVQRRVASYANLVRSPQVLEPVIEELGLDTTPGELASRSEEHTSELQSRENL